MFPDSRFPGPLLCLTGLLLAAASLLQPADSQESCERHKMLGENGRIVCGCPTDIGAAVRNIVAFNRSQVGYVNDIIPAKLPTNNTLQQFVLPKKLKYTLWPGGIVFYIINNAYNPAHQKLIKEAIEAVEEMVGRAHIEFKEAIAKSGEICRKNYVNIRPGKGDNCEANVGMNLAEPTVLNLGPRCMEPHVVTHELLHTLGMQHEQNRPIRDNHVVINFDKIYTPLCSNFKREESEDFDSLPYDIHSIMQYGSCLGTCDGSPVITNKTDGQTFDPIMKMSPGDVQKLRVMYPAKNKVTYGDQLCRGSNEPEEPVVTIIVRTNSNDTGKAGSRGPCPWSLTVLLLLVVVAMASQFSALIIDALA